MAVQRSVHQNCWWLCRSKGSWRSPEILIQQAWGEVGHSLHSEGPAAL